MTSSTTASGRDARAVRDALQGAVVEISGKVGNSGRLFGAVSAAAIADAVKEQLGGNGWIAAQLIFWLKVLRAV